MTVELVCVGTEILLGNIVNTNAAYLAEQCAMLGLSCYHQSVVGDNEQRMEETIRRAVSRSDIVILSGGLGPTKDDLTKEVTARVFDMELLEDHIPGQGSRSILIRTTEGRSQKTTGNRHRCQRAPW